VLESYVVLWKEMGFDNKEKGFLVLSGAIFRACIQNTKHSIHLGI
jgi:hypothetical protein